MAREPRPVDEFETIARLFAPPGRRRARRVRAEGRRRGDLPAAGPRSRGHHRRHGGGRPLPGGRPAGPRGPQAPAREPVRPRGQGGGAGRLPPGDRLVRSLPLGRAGDVRPGPSPTTSGRSAWPCWAATPRPRPGR
ncbi:MAG: hypothetical protein WDM92_02985 [Caulobacteraceae bacterium]